MSFPNPHDYNQIIPPKEAVKTVISFRSQYTPVPTSQGADPVAATPTPVETPRGWPDTPGMEKPEPLSSSTSPTPPHLGYTPPTQSWNPVTLRPWFAATLLSTMAAAAIALEVALHFSNTKTGWAVSGVRAATTGIYHYIYTLPPVAVAMIFVALWAWTDVDIKRMQPYIDLAYGNASAKTSLLLDYSTKHPGLVTYFAMRRNHWLVALSSLMVLLGLAIQPLAASLFTVKDIWWDGPNLNVALTEKPTQFTGTTFNTTVFQTASGFVQSAVLYNATIPNFVGPTWAITRQVVPKDQVANGTMFAPTTAFKSAGNCVAANNITPPSASNGQTFIATSTNSSTGTCTMNIPIAQSPSLQFGLTTTNCTGLPSSIPAAVLPVVFWIYNSDPNVNGGTPLTSAVFCRPTVKLQDIIASIALFNGQFLVATTVGDSTLVRNVTDPNGPFAGRALNGVEFGNAETDAFTQSRELASTLGVASAIIQNATATPGGLEARVKDGKIVGQTENGYNLYLSLIAKQIYFQPASASESIEVTTKTFRPRLFIVDVTAHILTVVLLSFAIIGTYIHISHYHLRDRVILPLQPGTLASAAAFTARSNVAQLLDANLDDKKLHEVLADKRFKIDRETGRIVWDAEVPRQRAEGEEGADVRRRKTFSVGFNLGKKPAPMRQGSL